MPYSEPEIAVLKKYRIMLPDGSFRQVDLRQPASVGGPPPGPGPLVSPDAINRLLAADTTDDKQWLDWIFFQAGGGTQAKEATADALHQIRDRFIDERTNGWTHPETGIFQAAVPRDQAEARWTAAESRFRDVLAVCDQDAVKRLRTFGFFRDWPGNGSCYAHIVEAMEKYLKLYSKLLQMNKELIREGGEPLGDAPEKIPTHTNMADIAKKVERYFASKIARTDMRHQVIYSDEIISAVAPLTYAAAVHFGYDLWPWASRKGFEAVLSGEGGDWRFRDEWKQRTSSGRVIVYLTFRGPVPAWTTRHDGKWEVKDLSDLALELDKAAAKSNPDDWTVYDEENKNTLTIGQVKQMILDEPNRVDSAEEETPFMRGKNAYSTYEEAVKVVASLDRAVQTVKKWLFKFDPSTIKSDALTLFPVEKKKD